jgi:hypothetical protein
VLPSTSASRRLPCRSVVTAGTVMGRQEKHKVGGRARDFTPEQGPCTGVHRSPFCGLFRTWPRHRRPRSPRASSSCASASRSPGAA